MRRSGTRIATVAADLGVSGKSLRQWLKQATVDSGEGPAGALTTEEREELRRLRRENKTLQLERELMPEEGWPTKEAARAAVFAWIAVDDHRQRRHSSIGYLPPVAFEISKGQDQAA